MFFIPDVDVLHFDYFEFSVSTYIVYTKNKNYEDEPIINVPKTNYLPTNFGKLNIVIGDKQKFYKFSF